MIQQAVKDITSIATMPAVIHVTVRWLVTYNASYFPTKTIKIGSFFGRCLGDAVLWRTLYRRTHYTPCFSRWFVYLWSSSCRPRWFRNNLPSCCTLSLMHWLVMENCEQSGLYTQDPGLTPLANFEGPIHPCRWCIQNLPGQDSGSAIVRDRYQPQLGCTHRNISPLWG